MLIFRSDLFCFELRVVLLGLGFQFDFVELFRSFLVFDFLVGVWFMFNLLLLVVVYCCSFLGLLN